MNLIDDILDGKGHKAEIAFFKHIELDSDLKEITSLFEENDIEFEVSSADVIVDRVIVGEGIFSKYTLKIYPAAFKKANALIKEHNSKKDIRIEDFEHLTQLTDEELFDIIENPSEWSGESEIVAKKILQRRDVIVSEEEISKIRHQKLLDLRKGKSVPLLHQMLYFICIAMGFNFGIIFIIAGIGMGYYYSFGKATDSEGGRYYIYEEKARQIGKFILFGGLICFVIQILIMFQLLSS